MAASSTLMFGGSPSGLPYHPHPMAPTRTQAPTIATPALASTSPSVCGMPHHVSRACDLCHTRKVKCDGSKPCGRCTKGGLKCSFDKPVLPKGPAPKHLRPPRHRNQSSPNDNGPSGVGPSRSGTPLRRVAFYPSPEVRTTRTPSSAGSQLAIDLDPGPVGATAAGAPSTSPSVPTADVGMLDALDPLSWLAETACGPELARFNLETDFEVGPETHVDVGEGSQAAETSCGSESRSGSETRSDSDLQSSSPSSDEDEGMTSLVVSRVSSRPASRPPSRAGLGQGLFATESGIPRIGPFSNAGASFGLGGLGLGGLLGGGLGGSLRLGGLGNSSGFSSGPYGLSGLGMPSPLMNMPFVPPAEVSPILTLTLETLIKPQLLVFYERIYPMMPVFAHHELLSRLEDPRSLADKTFVALVLAKVALSLVHPLTTAEMEQRSQRARQATTLLDEVCRLRSGWEYGCRGSVEAVLTSYCMFGTLFELGHADGARFRLLEGIVMGHVMRLGEASSYVGLPHHEVRRRMRMYWILAITERAYALQRSVSSIVFTGSITTSARGDDTGLAEGVSLHHLARVFSVIDADIVVCWNGQCGGAGRCRTLTRRRASKILRRLQGSAAHVFGDEDGLLELTESQKADLLITWQWIRNRIWRLAALHGLTQPMREDGEGEEGDMDTPELTPAYVLDAAATTVAICRRLSLAAMEAHGVGFVEKIYDIASTVAELVQDAGGGALTLRSDRGQCTQMLQTLSGFVARHRAGAPFAVPLTQAITVANALRVLSAGV